MSLIRIIRYGILLWLIGFVIAFVEIQLAASRTVITVIFYGLNIVLPPLFAWFFFERLRGTFTMRTVAEVLLGWIAIAFIFDLAVFWWFYSLPFLTVMSLQQIIGFVAMFCAGVAAGWFVMMKRRLAKPEGME